MAGGLAEWCQDWYGPYPETPVVDPQGPEGENNPVCIENLRKIIRGGSCQSRLHECRSAWRLSVPVNSTSSAIGFRVLLETR